MGTAEGHKDTTMGGQENAFQVTRWSEMRKARTHDEQRRQASINNLIQRYWKPVYCYLRRKGCSNDDAKDLTQGFFCEVVLGRNLIQQADEAKGRFRTFLLTALDRYVTSVHRKESARKRRPEAGLLSFESEGLPEMPADQAEASPEHAFYYAWATNILDEVLAEIQMEYCSTGRSIHWEAFRRKILSPIFDCAEEPSLSVICRECGIDSEKQASNMIVTVKRRFATILRRVLRRHVQSERQVEEEFGQLLKALCQGHAA
jgi:RNA polymerase sigma-70 factor (ECF subfamily)